MSRADRIAALKADPDFANLRRLRSTSITA